MSFRLTLSRALFLLGLSFTPALAEEPMTFQMVDGRAIAIGAFQPDSHINFMIFLAGQGKLEDQWNVPLYITSGGGALQAALAMGRMIRERGMSVVAHEFCASACTYMTYGGVNRVITKGTQFGVHQISFTGPGADDPNAPRFSNQFLEDFQKDIADLHDYTRGMGVDTQVIAIASRTPASGITWLTREQLVGLNIDNTPSADPEGQALETINIPGVTAPNDLLAELSLDGLYNQVARPDASRGLTGLAESVSISLAQRVVLAESQTREEMDKSLLNSYALNVDFNGQVLPSEVILSEKRRMIADWPVRRRAIETETVKASCSEGSETCTVSGIVNTELGLSEDGFISKARWSFVVEVISPMAAPRVTRETINLMQ